MPKAQRAKGNRGERATATEIREAFVELADDIKRGWQAARGDNAPDIEGVPGFWIENKTLKKFNTAPLDQAVEASAGKGVIPFAVIRPDRKDPVVMIRWFDFLGILQDVIDGKLEAKNV